MLQQQQQQQQQRRGSSSEGGTAAAVVFSRLPNAGPNTGTLQAPINTWPELPPPSCPYPDPAPGSHPPHPPPTPPSPLATAAPSSPGPQLPPPSSPYLPAPGPHPPPHPPPWPLQIPITWPELANLHPFAPLDQAQGYQEMFDVGGGLGKM